VTEAPPAVANRMLGTVLALDVGEHAGAPPARGGMRWPRAMSQADRLLRAEIERHGGRVLRGPDGTVSLFAGPTRAIAAAAGAQAALESVGLYVRAAIHAGECEVVGERVTGHPLQTCVALAAEAAPGELLLTGVVADLMAGASLVLEPRGGSGADPALRVHSVRALTGGAAH
jgi:class 3 adenylate cyclase